MAPFPFFNRILNEHRLFPITCYGARSADELVYLEEFHQQSDRVLIATDDGSAGLHGFVTQILEEQLQQVASEAVVYACGPNPMLHRVKAIAEKYGSPAYLSMEEVMGCGIGICIGCPIPVNTADGSIAYALCCKEGPIFPSSVVRV